MDPDARSPRPDATAAALVPEPPLPEPGPPERPPPPPHIAYALAPDQQQQQQQQQHPPEAEPAHQPDDASLSAIQAFNQSFPGTPADAHTNEWGKRPAGEDHAGDGDAAASKRQHLDDVNEHADLFLATAAASFGDHAHTINEHNMGDAPQPMDQDDDPDYQDEDEDEDGADEEEIAEETAVVVAATAGAYLQPPAVNLLDPSTFIFWDATQTLRIQSLPILDNLSTQILQTLGKGPYQETLNIVTQPDSDQGQAYNTMKSLFDQTKKLYTHEAFLAADDLKLDRPEQRATIRKVNLATFVSSVFGSQEVGFFHLNEHFLDTFVPDGGRLLKSQGALYLDLKTQAYISAMSTNERAKEEILEDLFPENMKDILFARRPGAKSLTPSEQDFVLRLGQRRAHLRDYPDDFNLSEKYVWQDFLKEVSWYVSKNYEAIVAQPSHAKPRKRRASTSGSQQPLQQPPMMAQLSPGQGEVDAATAAAMMAHTAAQHVPHPAGSPDQSQPPTAPQQQLDEPYAAGPNTSYMGLPPPAAPPVPQQSAPTQVLYERARLAATSKASPNARRAGLPSQRRPWSTEEENALMAGLDRVKGPHWSQILAMFGPGGTVSEALKDRNQVQLKDKARNLKLFFLKSGIEVPYYLQFVTGELKTRAPGQAAKNAAKKAVEEHAAEDAAHVAAVTALGNAHRGINSHQDQQDLLARTREHRLEVEAQIEAEQQELQDRAASLEQQELDAADADDDDDDAVAGDGDDGDGVGPSGGAPVADMAPVAQMGPTPADAEQLPDAPNAAKDAAAASAAAAGEHDLEMGQDAAATAAVVTAVDPALSRTDVRVSGHQVSAERGT